MAPSRWQGALTAGDMPEGTLLKHVLTTKARLGSGGKGDGCSLKACIVSGDVALTAVKLVIQGRKHNSDGARFPFSKPTHTSA